MKTLISNKLSIQPQSLRGWVLPLALLAVWWLAVGQGWSHSNLLVSPGAVWDAAVTHLQNGDIQKGLLASLRRNVIGFAIGAGTGLAFGSLIGISRWGERLLAPSFHTFKQISLFAWIPLISVWFGLGDAAKVAFIAMAAFFPLVLNTFEGIRSVPRELLDIAQVYRFSTWQRWRRVVLPWTAPSVLTGVHLALIYSWLATLGAEYLLVSGEGIGNLLIDGREHFRMDQVLLGVVVIGLVGYSLNVVVSAIEKRVLAWRANTIARY